MLGIGLVLDKSVGIETIYAAVFIFFTLTVYYFVMIYHGIRYDNGISKWKWDGVSIKDMLNEMANSGINVNGLEIPDFDFSDNLIGGIIGALIAIIIGFVVLGIIVLLTWLGINLVGYALVLAWIPLYILIKYGVRLALVNVKYAKGNIIRSAFLSLTHGCIGALSMAVVFYVTEFVVRIIFS